MAKKAKRKMKNFELKLCKPREQEIFLQSMHAKVQQVRCRIFFSSVFILQIDDCLVCNPSLFVTIADGILLKISAHCMMSID